MDHSDGRIFDADAEAVVDATTEAASGRVFSVVEYDAERFNVLHTDEALDAFYGSRAQMLSHFERIHSYVHVDFTEMELFTDELFPVADRVDYVVTGMDFATLVRIYVGDFGLFLSLSPDEEVKPVVDVVIDVLDA